MRFAYFPFTYITEPVASLLYDLFGGVVIYQPDESRIPANVRQLAKAGKIELRFPVRGGEDRLSAEFLAYRQWGEIHQKQSAAMAARPEESAYPSDFIARIRSEILGRAADLSDRADPLFSARLFLLMAQQYDQDQDDIERELARAERSRKELLSKLDSGSARALPQKPPFPQADAGEHMTPSRLSAWCHLIQEDPITPPVLVTTSPAVMSHILETLDVKIHSIRSGPPGKSPPDELVRALSALAETPWSGTDIVLPALGPAFSENFQFQVKIIESTPPDRLCRLITGVDPPAAEGIGSAANTVILELSART